MKFEELNKLGSQRIPFLFICDFKVQNIQVIPLDELENADVSFCINENYSFTQHPHSFQKTPLSFQKYNTKFETVIEKIKRGETYLLNLTQPTKIETSLSLQEIYTLANAHYKLKYKDQFVCFSPETFIKVAHNTIHTYPMKGTIDASIANAKENIAYEKRKKFLAILLTRLGAEIRSTSERGISKQTTYFVSPLSSTIGCEAVTVS